MWICAFKFRRRLFFLHQRMIQLKLSIHYCTHHITFSFVLYFVSLSIQDYYSYYWISYLFPFLLIFFFLRFQNEMPCSDSSMCHDIYAWRTLAFSQFGSKEDELDFAERKCQYLSSWQKWHFQTKVRDWFSIWRLSKLRTRSVSIQIRQNAYSVISWLIQKY